MPTNDDITSRILTAGAMGWRGLNWEEVQLLRRLAQGLASKEIAAEQGVSIRTVEKRRETAYRKLEANSAAHAVAILFKQGIFL